MEDLQGDLGQIRLHDPPRPTSLQLDRMFDRVTAWAARQPPRSFKSGGHASTTSGGTTIGELVEAEQGPSGSSQVRRPYPLPRRSRAEQRGKPSPLEGLFDYPELTPMILDKFEHPRDLAVLARVSKGWCGLVRRRLYEHVWVRPCE